MDNNEGMLPIRSYNMAMLLREMDNRFLILEEEVEYQKAKYEVLRKEYATLLDDSIKHGNEMAANQLLLMLKMTNDQVVAAGADIKNVKSKTEVKA